MRNDQAESQEAQTWPLAVLLLVGTVVTMLWALQPLLRVTRMLRARK
jgi:hypothetical protein